MKTIKQNNNATGTHLCKFFDILILRKRKAGKHSTADLYRATNNWLKEFTKGRPIKLKKVTDAFVEKFYNYLLSQGYLKTNSIVSYISNFRAMYNTAVREKLVRPRISPFSHLPLHRGKTLKRAIPKKMIEKICLLDLPHPKLAFVADLCIFTYLACGMSFVDLSHLQTDNIIGDEIIYNRIKTGTLIRIHITKGMQLLLDKYKGKNGSFLFPILKKGEKTTHEEYKSLLQNYNKHLKEIGKKLNPSIQLTSYVIRHSWATEALKRHTPVATISQALGHTSEKTTRYYLDQLDQSELDQANALITNSLDCILQERA